MAATEVIAFHGWGFNAAFWKPWQDKLESRVDFRSEERGYFGESSQIPQFSSSARSRILMAHSYGLHRCESEHFEHADLLLIFGGFLQFHPVAAQYRRRSKMVLTQMIHTLKQDPLKVLEEFYENTFKPRDAGRRPEGEPQVELLIEDLHDLDRSEVNIMQMKKVDKICILHGFEDGIVPRRKGRELYDQLHAQAQYFEIKKAGHALPITHLEQCWNFLITDITELIS